MSAGLIGVALVLLAGATACAKDASAPRASSPTTTAPSSSTAAASPSPTPSSTLPPGVDQLIVIKVSQGHVTGPKGRVPVKRGSRVQLRVTSDVSDEVHLHGYDKSVDVKAGRTARLTFTASIPGIFEVELESRALRLTQLQVK